jgi:hypothetical protein
VKDFNDIKMHGTTIKKTPISLAIPILPPTNNTADKLALKFGQNFHVFHRAPINVLNFFSFLLLHLPIVLT